MQSFHLVILGSETSVGTALTELAQGQNLSMHAITSEGWALKDLTAMHATMKELSPSIIVNCIMPSPTGTTVEVAKVLAQVCESHGISLLQLSSNLVFAGQEGEIFKEEDEPRPITLAGQHALAVETVISDTCSHYLILRTGWLFCSQGGDDVSQLLILAREQSQLRLSDNKQMSPTSACDVADVLLAMVMQARFAELWGTYHYSNSEPTTLFKFAEVVVAEARQYEELQVEEIENDASSDMNTLFSESSPKLATKKLLFTFGIQPKAWRPALSRTLKKRYLGQ